MSELDDALDALRSHDGVQGVLVLGRDGLLVHQRGGASLDAETISAMAPGLASACDGIGGSAGLGRFRTAAVQFETGVAVVAALSGDLLLAVPLRSDVAFGSLLRDIAARREAIAALV